jgi:hypothetical protein
MFLFATFPNAKKQVSHIATLVVLGGVTVIVLAIEPNVRGFKPGRERWNFKSDKNP